MSEIVPRCRFCGAELDCLRDLPSMCTACYSKATSCQVLLDDSKPLTCAKRCQETTACEVRHVEPDAGSCLQADEADELTQADIEEQARRRAEFTALPRMPKKRPVFLRRAKKTVQEPKERTAPTRIHPVKPPLFGLVDQSVLFVHKRKTCSSHAYRCKHLQSKQGWSAKRCEWFGWETLTPGAAVRSEECLREVVVE